MKYFNSSYGEIAVQVANERIEVQGVSNDLSCDSAAIVMQEYLDQFPDGGKFGLNEVGDVEEWEDNLFIANIF